MPRVRVDNVGAVGIVKDVPSYELPANAWSDAQNVRMQDGSVHKAKGYEPIWTTPAVAPYFLFPVETEHAYYWLYAGLSKVYTIQNTYHFDITRASGDYNANSIYRWSGDILGGVPILNNGVDAPQFWQFPLSHTQLLQDLTAWPSSDRCRVMRAYKNYLIALHVTRSGTTYPTMVKWSDNADIGAVPQSWDETDPTTDAGETFLSEAGGPLVDGRQLRDSFMLYRSGSTWGMQFIGGGAIFRFYQIFPNSGCLARECVTEFFGQHFVVTGDDIILHDGQNPQSIAQSRVRRFLFNDIDADHYDQTFVVANHPDKEIWICYPTSGQTFPDKALVWNYRENSWAPRDLPNTPHVASGVVDANATDVWDPPVGPWFGQTATWSTAVGTWSSGDETSWDEEGEKMWNHRTFQLLDTGLLFADAGNVRIWEGDATNEANSATLSASVERKGLALVGQDKTDLFVRKRVRAIYPHLEGDVGSTVQVSVGTQDAIGGTVTYATARSFTIGTDYKVDCDVDGRLIAVKFESNADAAFRLHGYQLDIEVTGAE